VKAKIYKSGPRFLIKNSLEKPEPNKGSSSFAADFIKQLKMELGQ